MFCRLFDHLIAGLKPLFKKMISMISKNDLYVIILMQLVGAYFKNFVTSEND